MDQFTIKMYDLTGSKKDVFTFLDLQTEFVMDIRPNGSIIMAHCNKDPSKKQVLKLRLKQTPEELEKNRRDFYNDVQSTARLNHPNVVSGMKSAVCPNYFVTCTNFYPLGNLAGMIPELNRVGIEFYLSQIACAVHYIHCQGVVHLDLNPRHVLIDFHGNAVLSDFGNSRILLKPRNILVRSGAEGFRAPEVSGSMGIDPFKVDMYAVGLILWNMVYARPPKNEGVVRSFLYSGDFRKEENYAFRSVFFGCLNQSPELRWNSQKLLSDLVEKIPTMANMIQTLMDHTCMPHHTSWISGENFLQHQNKKRS